MEKKEVLKRFKPKYRSLLGIDISPTSVKILELSCISAKPCIENYAYERLSPNVNDTNTAKDIDALASSIKKLLAQTKAVSKFVALAVSDSTVISKTIQLANSLNDLELEELVYVEADKYLSCSSAEINIDFAIQGANEKKLGMVDVLLVACRKETLHRRVEAIKRAGLQAKFVDVESYAVARVVQQLLTKEMPLFGQDKSIAVINIGMQFTHLFIVEKGRVTYTKEDVFGVKQLLDAIAEHYQLSIEEAFILQTHTPKPADFELELLQPFIAMILVQIKRNLQFFVSMSYQGLIDHIFLAGDLGSLGILASLIEQETGISTSVANPFKHLDVSKHINYEMITNLAPSFLVACGLALRGVNGHRN